MQELSSLLATASTSNEAQRNTHALFNLTALERHAYTIHDFENLYLDQGSYFGFGLDKCCNFTWDANVSIKERTSCEGHLVVTKWPCPH